MEWPLKMDFGDGLFVNAILSLSARNGEVYLEFQDEKNETFLIDTLSRMQTIQFDDTDPLKVTMKGDDIFRQFYLTSEDAVANIWTFFQNYQKLVPLPGKHKIFAVRPKTERQQPSPNKNSQAIRSNSMPRSCFSETPEALSHGIIRESLSDIKVVTVTEKNLSEIFNENGELKVGLSMSEIEISPSFLIDCWRRILGIKEFLVGDYIKLKSQWKEIQQSAWESNSKLREFVSNCERSLQKHTFNISGGEEIAFNALVSSFVESMNSINFQESYVDIVVLLTNSLLAGKVGEKFVSQSGDSVTQDEASGVVFTLFNAYLEKMKNVYNNLYDDTMQLLMLTSPSTNQLLMSVGIKDFDFMKDDISFFFCKEREIEDSQLILTGAFAAHSTDQYVRSLIAACFTLLHNRLVEIANQQPAFFCETFLCLIPSINVRVLLQDIRIFSDFVADED